MSKTLGRFQLRDQNELLPPGKCATCGGIQGEFIDFGFDMDFYGCIYFCTTCFREACLTFGYHSPAEFDALDHQVTVISQANCDLELENEELRNAVATFNRLTELMSRRTDSASSDGSNDVDEKPKRASKAANGTKSRAAKQTNEQGSTDVLDDEELNKLLDDGSI